MDKKYYVQVLFKSGNRLEFETDTYIPDVKPLKINGTEMVFTAEEHGINMLKVEELNIRERI